MSSLHHYENVVGQRALAFAGVPNDRAGAIARKFSSPWVTAVSAAQRQRLSARNLHEVVDPPLLHRLFRAAFMAAKADSGARRPQTRQQWQGVRAASL